MKTAIISGITGQDGGYLAKLLLTKNYKIIGLTRSYNGINTKNLEYLGIANRVVMEECDLLDFSSILKILSKYNPEEFYNLGAQSSVGQSFEQPIGTLHYNTISVLNILESVRILDLKTHFYQASSSEMYGKSINLPITHETPFHPLSPYAISKATAYWTTINYRESYNIYAVNGILFNHESYLRAPNFFVKKILKGAIDILNGKMSKLLVGNIDIKRDFGYAPDYVEAMYLSLQNNQPDDYFICSGTSIYLRDIIGYVFDKAGIAKDKIFVDPSLYRPVEIIDLFGDNSKAKTKLKWNYQKSFYDVLDLLWEEEIRNYK